jgi:hypothetical protein
MNKKRIAFCFSWQARTFDTTYPFFKINLFDAAKEQWFEYDIFCAVEDDEDLEKIYLMNPTIVEKIKSLEVQKIIDEKYWEFINENFNKKYCIHMYKKWNINWFLQQVYKVKIANYIKNNYINEYDKKYDIVIRLRFDTLFLNKFNFNRIYNSIKEWKNILNIWTRNIVPIQDFFAIGNNDFINSFSSVFDNFRNIFRWREISIYKKGFLFLLNFLYYFHLYIEKRIWGFISRIIWYLTHLIATFINKYIFTVYTFENIYFQNLKIKNYIIFFTSISFILVRKDFKKSFAMLLDKSEFEI